MAKYYTPYRHVAFEKAGEPPTADEIAAIEALLGAELPASFIDYLGVANGVSHDYVLDVTVDGRPEQLGPGNTFSTHEGGPATFLEEIALEREVREIPAGVLPFGTDGASVVYLDLTPEGGGRVVAYVEGMPAWAGGGESGFVEVAASFDDYLSLLKIEVDSLLELLDKPSLTDENRAAIREYLDIGMPGWRADARWRTLLP